jgi:hypothetical protein
MHIHVTLQSSKHVLSAVNRTMSDELDRCIKQGRVQNALESCMQEGVLKLTVFNAFE